MQSLIQKSPALASLWTPMYALRRKLALENDKPSACLNNKNAAAAALLIVLSSYAQYLASSSADPIAMAHLQAMLAGSNPDSMDLDVLKKRKRVEFDASEGRAEIPSLIKQEPGVPPPAPEPAPVVDASQLAFVVLPQSAVAELLRNSAMPSGAMVFDLQSVLAAQREISVQS